MLLRREALKSSQIEGTQEDLFDLFLDAAKVAANVETYRERLLSDVHAVLPYQSRGIGERQGEFRTVGFAGRAKAPSPPVLRRTFRRSEEG